MTSKYYYCPSCQERNAFSSMASDRVELEREKGERIPVECEHCHSRTKLHVNQVRAEPNKIITGASAVAGVVGAVALWQVGFIAAITVGLPVLVYQMQSRSASTFNSYKIKETE